MFRAKYEAMKIIQILMDYRLSVRLQHLINDFKLVRRASVPSAGRAAVLMRKALGAAMTRVGARPAERPAGARGHHAAGPQPADGPLCRPRHHRDDPAAKPAQGRCPAAPWGPNAGTRTDSPTLSVLIRPGASRRQALTGGMTTSEAHTYLRHLFGRTSFLDHESLVPSLVTAAKYDYSDMQILGTFKAQDAGHPRRVALTGRWRGHAGAAPRCAATDLLNCHFSQVEMLLTDAREAMVLIAKPALDADEKITELVRRCLRALRRVDGSSWCGLWRYTMWHGAQGHELRRLNEIKVDAEHERALVRVLKELTALWYAPRARRTCRSRSGPVDALARADARMG